MRAIKNLHSMRRKGSEESRGNGSALIRMIGIGGVGDTRRVPSPSPSKCGICPRSGGHIGEDEIWRVRRDPLQGQDAVTRLLDAIARPSEGKGQNPLDVWIIVDNKESRRHRSPFQGQGPAAPSSPREL